jgi:hypothetical protein
MGSVANEIAPGSRDNYDLACAQINRQRATKISPMANPRRAQVLPVSGTFIVTFTPSLKK